MRHAADLVRDAHGVAELVEAVAQALAVVEDLDLVPDIGDRVAVGRAGHAAAVLEVFGDFGHRLAALAGVVFKRGGLVDDYFGESFEEGRLLLGEPLGGIDIGDVDVGIRLERRRSISSIGDRYSERGGKLLNIVDPHRAQQ